jgi:uncharacterized protein YkwD
VSRKSPHGEWVAQMGLAYYTLPARSHCQTHVTREAPVQASRILPTLMISAALLIAPWMVPGAQAEPVTGTPLELDGPQLAADVITLTNIERERAGLAPLHLQTQLSRMAQQYADVLADGSCFGHTCGLLPSLDARAQDVDYDYRLVGENVGGGQRSAEEVVRSWMASLDHRANILNADFEDIGVGVTTGASPYSVYWVQVVGASLASVGAAH